VPKTPHISVPIDETRRRINAANHHVYRAGKQDTAYELKRAADKLNESLRMIEAMQRDYPLANPATIDTSIEAWDPSIAPPPLDDESEAL
jgi:hypothetical protein